MVERHRHIEQKPPNWWHDAIRNNIPGSQINPDRFESFPISLEGKYVYTIVSQTSNDPKGFPEGIFVDTSIPANMVKNLEPMMMTIMAPITEVLKKEGQAHTEIVAHPDPRLAALGLKLNVGNSFNIGVNISNGFVVLAIEPTSVDDAKEYDAKFGFDQFKQTIVDRYFDNIDLVERAKLLSDPEMPDLLKKEILKREFALMRDAVGGAVKSDLIKQKRLEQLANDRLTQRQYEALMQEIVNFQTPEQKIVIQNRLNIMDNATLAGFFAYYQKYWQEKLGPIG